MSETLSRNWWILGLRGLAAIIFGLLLSIFPTMGIEALIIVFAAYALVDGVSTIITAVRNRQTQNWWVHLLEGIVSVLAGLATVIFPILSVLVLVTGIGFWAIITGVLQIWTAVELRKQIDNEWLMGLMGLLSILAGALLVINPVLGAQTLVVVAGAYSIAFGVLMIILAFRLRNWQSPTTTTTTQDRAGALG
jgi:uncharacterized membrane protein HdeD (DUF308 family)